MTSPTDSGLAPARQAQAAATSGPATHHCRRRADLRASAILLVLAATAVPVELRGLGHATFDFKIYPVDFVANIIGYLILGVMLAAAGPLRAVAVAALISTISEISQIVMMHRDPSAMDILANTIGAALGAGCGARWKWSPPTLALDRRVGWAGLTAAGAILIWSALAQGEGTNTRGFTSPGALEAHWKLDEAAGGPAQDSSGHGLSGTFHRPVKPAAGVIGGAIAFDGHSDWIDVAPSETLQLAGSMTITAWIKPTGFPRDDAAIVSGLYRDGGYQLDATADTGPRTIGFKLTNVYGELMVRYGATPLAPDTWHHVAGVYNAPTRTLQIYLDGRPDDGPLSGTVTSQQRSSRVGASLGRRSDEAGYEYAGSMDDVRIYSLPLSQAQIVSVMHGDAIDGSTGPELSLEAGARIRMSDDEDKLIPLRAAALGMLAALAVLGLWPSAEPKVGLLAGLLAGLLLVPLSLGHLPLFNAWLLPLTSLAGGASIALTTRRS